MGHRRTLFALNEQKEGDEMAAAGNYSGAEIMYRQCMEQDDACLLKLFGLIHEEKIKPQSTDEFFPLINPLAQKGNAQDRKAADQGEKNAIAKLKKLKVK